MFRRRFAQGLAVASLGGVLATMASLVQATSSADDAAAVARAALGRQLFVDARLSADGAVSCASCHRPESDFTDSRTVSRGRGGLPLARNAPSLLDVGERPLLFWDGRATTLEAQATMPLFGGREHALKDEAALVRAVARDPAYVEAFDHAFAGEPTPRITLAHVAAALAAYERTLISGQSAFDRFRSTGDDTMLTESARRGWAVFRGPAHCIGCHTVTDTGRATFTDDAFHPSSLGLPPAVRSRAAALVARVERLHRRGDASLSAAIAVDGDLAALGRFAVTLDPRDIGLYRTPGLRDVARTGPYMHDGSVPTLADAVDRELYRQDGAQRKPLPLSPQERADLLDFLQALTADATPSQ